MRLGHGYDIHRLVEHRPLVLGGVTIPHPQGLEGHSDADVLLHAIIDALLGAVGAGDIGTHFPSTDDAYRQVSSLELLARAQQVVRERGFLVSSIDTTVLAEAPNLTPFKAAMTQRIASALGLPAAAVNVKAHTMEGLGPIGEGRAMAAHAVVLVQESTR